MILTLYLARVLGLALIALGVIVALRYRYYMTVYPLIVTERAARMALAVFALIFGLMLALADTLWQTLPSMIISLTGWMIVIKGLVYLALPEAQLAKLVAAINKPITFIVGGIVAVIIGAYLTVIGFGLLF